MKIFLRALCMALIFALPAHAQTALPSALTQALRQAELPNTSVGIFVQEVDARKPVLVYGEERAMNPASTMKLLTTYAALELLGPAYTWKTEVYIDGPVEGDVLNGNLILKGYGDPRLTFENFWLLLRNIRQRGIREIRGDLIVDRTYFPVAENDPGRFDNDPTRAYNVAPDALLLNFKTIRFQFIPDLVKKTVMIRTEPNPEQLEIVNKLKLAGECGDWKPRLGAEYQDAGKRTRVTFTGSYGVNCAEKNLYVGLFDHPDYIHGVFKQLWSELGGTLKGGIKDSHVPAGAKLFASNESLASLAEVVRDINKYSNNVMARQLFLTIGKEASGTAGVEQSTRVIRSWLAQKNIDFTELVLENGSGLSRQERISAKHLGEVLLAAYHSPVMPELMASLPLVAVDGTMKKRLNGLAVAGHAHIKSGSLSGVKTIAGYVLDNQGRRWVVVCMINHANAANGQAAQDALMQWVYARAPKEVN